MHPILACLLAVLLVLSPAILYGFGLIAIALYRGRCSACGQRGLKLVNAIKATIIIEGERASDFWSYYLCEKCDVVFKRHRGVWSHATEDEIELYVRRSTVGPRRLGPTYDLLCSPRRAGKKE